MIASESLISEIRRVLGRPKFRRYIPEEAIPSTLRRISEAATLTRKSEENPRSFVDDPKDDYLIELALATRADAIVSGDRHLHDPSKELPVRVIRPADFLAELEQSS